MGKFSRVALATALMVPLASAPVWAQQYKADFGINGGYSWYRAMLGSDETGLPDGTDWDDAKFEAGWLAGTQFTYWLSPKLGLRANGTFSERPVVASNVDALDNNEDGNEYFDDVNLWTLTGDLLFRFKEPNESWMGSEFLPYLALGIGGKWHNPGGDVVECVDPQENETWACGYIAPPGGNTFGLGEQKVIAGLVGLGADWRLSPRFALRMELSDRIYKPQVYEGTINAAQTTVTLTDGDDNVSQIVHEVGAQLGLHMLFGLEERQMVAVQPLPPPPPAAPPAPPAAPPAPTEENIMVCVVDPTSGTGIRMQPAMRIIATGDTMVTMGGQRVPLGNAIGNVMVARNADWYVSGQPLVMEISPNNRVEFISYGSARQVAASDLEFVGRVNGYPLYIESSAAAEVRDELGDLRDARMRNDLADILEEEQELNAELAKVQYWYVPLQPAGCVFQPLQRSLPVIKKDEQK